jgi:hypothetical protein
LSFRQRFKFWSEPVNLGFEQLVGAVHGFEVTMFADGLEAEGGFKGLLGTECTERSFEFVRFAFEGFGVFGGDGLPDVLKHLGTIAAEDAGDFDEEFAIATHAFEGGFEVEGFFPGNIDNLIHP